MMVDCNLNFYGMQLSNNPFELCKNLFFIEMFDLRSAAGTESGAASTSLAKCLIND